MTEIEKAAVDMADAAYFYIHQCPPHRPMVAQAWRDFCAKRDAYRALAARR